ncbi:hypothetical protein HAX54_004489, partial [Datura stramonium]|nr:hypothetical protein [Datura stramonium]
MNNKDRVIRVTLSEHQALNLRLVFLIVSYNFSHATSEGEGIRGNIDLGEVDDSDGDVRVTFRGTTQMQ